MIEFSHNMTITALHNAYADGSLTPQDLLSEIRNRAADFADHNIWIHLLSEEEQSPYHDALNDKDPETYPLWGIPFAIKDNIDLEGIPTTAGCAEFAYTPEASAQVVQQLIDAGAIPVGKTNLDQFATGLNGTRSPWGACKNSFNPEYISGGSSSGSSVAVALGLASFSLGTDTAGSGRVPACFNNLVGLKPTIGLLSATGLVPACRSLDCITVFAYNTDDANQVLSVAEGYDARDAYSRPNPFQNQTRNYGERIGTLKIGIIPQAQLKFFGDNAYAKAYQATLDQLAEQDIEWVEIDYAPFSEVAKLLYEGPWVAERYIAALPLIKDNPNAIFPVVRDIVAPGGEPKATTLFIAEYRLNELKKRCNEALAELDCLLTPTAGKCFTIEGMLAEPVLYNSQLGFYTNFMNLLDLASIAVPTQIADNGLPFGITLVGPTFSDRALLSIAKRFNNSVDLPIGASSIKAQRGEAQPIATTSTIDVLVCGAHLKGLPLNWQLTERGGALKTKTRTAPIYRMYALADGPPFRPGLVLDEDNGAAIEVEIWSVPAEQFGSFVNGIPAPLGIGKVRVDDGSVVSGFICEPYAIKGAKDITQYSSWKSYIATSPSH